jgi:hypothetical protein
MSEKLLDKLIDFGPMAFITIVLIYGAYKLINKVLDANRKDIEGLAKRINKVEDDDRDRNIQAIRENTSALKHNAETNIEVKEVMQEVKYAISQCKNKGKE